MVYLYRIYIKCRNHVYMFLCSSYLSHSKYCFLSPEPEHATNLSLQLMKLFPLKAKVQWKMSSGKDLSSHFFKLLANGDVVYYGKATHAELSLNPGNNYSLIVETCFEDGTKSKSENYRYTTPTEDDSTYTLHVMFSVLV